jgi:outer membrane lipoprotein-sorting protein
MKTLKRCFRGVLLTATVIAVAVASAGAEEVQDATPRDLIKRAIENVPRVTSKARLKLSSDRGWTRDMELAHKRVGEREATYMEVTGPQDVRDTRFLFLESTEEEDEQWIRVPALRRAMRVASQTRKQAFLGSDFYVSDMVAPKLDDYEYEFVGDEEIGGRKCRLVQATPKDMEGEIYSKTVAAVDPKDLLVVRTEFYDLKGKLLKVWVTEKFEKSKDIWTPMVQVMTNVQDKTSSTIEVLDVEYGADLDDEMFTQAYFLR